MPDSVVETATAAIAQAFAMLTGAQIGEVHRDPDPSLARAAIAAVANVEEAWEGGPDAVPLPEHIVTTEGAFWPDGVTPFEITEDQMRAAGWKLRRRVVSDWVDDDGQPEVLAPADDPEPTYRVSGGQGHRDIARGVTYAEAVEIRDRFDAGCDRAGLMNPRTLITEEHP